MAEPARAEVCENCGAAIGKLETAHLWQEHVVCGLCHAKLSHTATAEQLTPAIPAAAIPYATPIGGHQPRRPAEKLKFGKPPAPLKAMCWIGIALWFGPALLATASGSSGEGFVQLEWVGAILTIGSLVVWAVIMAAKSTG